MSLVLFFVNCPLLNLLLMGAVWSTERPITKWHVMKKMYINVSILCGVLLTKKKVFMWGSNVIFIIICHSITGLSWPRSNNCILFISPIINIKLCVTYFIGIITVNPPEVRPDNTMPTRSSKLITLPTWGAFR